MKFIKENKIIILIILLSFIAGCGGSSSGPNYSGSSSGGSGELRLTTFNPYGIDISSSSNSVNYHNGLVGPEVVPNVVIERFRDYNYESLQKGISIEPFCKIGGMYKLNVYNNPKVNYRGTRVYSSYDTSLRPYNETFNLYYCKTTEDLINLIKIPEEWRDDSLIVYCNDGRNVFMEDKNFDFVLTLMNVYKACTVRNLDKDEAILFGLDVGNVFVDSNLAYFTNSENSQILTELENLDENTETISERTHETYVRVPMIPVQVEIGMGGDSGQTRTETYYRFLNESEIPEKIFEVNKELEEKEIISIERESYETEKLYEIIETTSEDQKNYKLTRNEDNSGGSLNPNTALYKVTYSQDISSFQGSYSSTDGVELFLNYNAGVALFEIMLNKYKDSQKIALTEIFTVPNEFKLSRVALFLRDEQHSKIYGFETPEIKYNSISKSVDPVYRINFENFENFECPEILGAYGGQKGTILGGSDLTICSEGGLKQKIELRTSLIDSRFETGRTFNLFKNIILDVELK